MAAVRCAARRLAGSLLQRKQAAVAEEGRRLVPSCRSMRSRLLSSEASGENACETEMGKQLRGLRSEVDKKNEELRRLTSEVAEKKAELRRLTSEVEEKKPTATQLPATMAAVRCAMRRLAEEGRRLASSRLLPSRGLSGEHAAKTAKERRTRRPTEFELRFLAFANATKTCADVARSLMVGTAKLTFACMVIACGYDEHKTKHL